MITAQQIKRALGATMTIALVATALVASPSATRASSHREAPLISQDPLADNTDLYAFRSPDKPDTVTIVANYIPLEEPNGGPNFVSFGDDVRYEIHIDNDGNAREDITYRFTFKTEIQNPRTFLYITGPVDSPTSPNFNFQQSYLVQRIVGDGAPEFLGSGVVPPVNVGPRSTPAYESIAEQAITELSDGSTVFAGQRDDPFYVDLGAIFDLGGLRPFNPAHLLPLDAEEGIDGVNGYNTHAIVLQVPISELTDDGKGAVDTEQPVLGIYASASRQRVRVLQEDGSVKNSGRWVQVSRLGNPLINEVIIPVGLKDYWNAQDPSKDGQFLPYYRRPELAGVINLLYGGALEDVDTTGRADLEAILLTGVPGLNFTGARHADLLRLNVSIDPTAAVGEGQIFGVLDGDLAGFPNGRRLEDDVTDIELRAVAQGYGAFLAGGFGLPNKSPNNLVSDGVQANELEFSATFPYLATPHSGYESLLHRNFAPLSSPQ